MRTFLVRVAPVALLAVPLVVYRGQFEGLDVSQGRVTHTFEARRLAVTIARNCGGAGEPARVASLLEKFAAETADNPAQVGASAAMRSALARGDLAGVAALADRASAEEDRLLAVRSLAYRRQADSLRRLADWVVGFAFLAVLLREVLDLLTRSGGFHPVPGGRRNAAGGV